MKQEIVEKLERIKEEKRIKQWRKEEERDTLQNIEDSCWITRHFRTEKYGNCTA